MRSKGTRKGAHEQFCQPRGVIEKLFWAHVDKRAKGDCWAWTGPVGPNGLGRISIRNGARGQTLTARRISMWLSGQVLPAGTVFVRGNCPNRTCVNPVHLTIGNSFAVTRAPPYLARDELQFRFYRRKQVATDTGCVLFGGAKTGEGYGTLTVVDGDGKKRKLFAHKVAYYLSCGYWPKPAELVCHHCDTPACVAPEHLYLGSPKTNGRDAAARGRHKRACVLALKKANALRGCYITRARQQSYADRCALTKADARQVLRWYAKNKATWSHAKPSCGCRWRYSTLMEKFRCCENTVRRAINNHVDEVKPETKARNEAIRRLYFGPDGHPHCAKAGRRTGRKTHRFMAEYFGVHISTITDIIYGITHRDLPMPSGASRPKK